LDTRRGNCLAGVHRNLNEFLSLLTCLEYTCDLVALSGLMLMLDTFNKKDTESSGRAEFSLDEVCVTFATLYRLL